MVSKAYLSVFKLERLKHVRQLLVHDWQRSDCGLDGSGKDSDGKDELHGVLKRKSERERTFKSQ